MRWFLMATISLKQIYVNLLLSEWKAVVCKRCTLYEKKSTTSVALQPPVTGLHHLVVVSGCFRRSRERISRSISPASVFKSREKPTRARSFSSTRSSSILSGSCGYTSGIRKDLLCHLLCGLCIYLNKKNIFFS